MKNIEFEPSAETKEMYLSTRKKEMTYGGFNHPGLFGTYNYSRDSQLFYVACVLEIIGLSLIVYYAKIELFYAIVIVILAFLLDLIFAIWHHSPQSKLQENKIKKVLVQTGPRLEQITRKINKYNNTKAVLTVPLVIMAIIKIAVFHAAYGMIDIIMLAIIISYIIVALIHIYITGYYISEFRRRKKRNKEYSIYINAESDTSTFKSTIKSHSFNCNEKLNVEKYADYGITKLENENTKYKIWANGLLKDSNLQELISVQPDNIAEFIVNREGLRFQYEDIMPYQTRND